MNGTKKMTKPRKSDEQLQKELDEKFMHQFELVRGTYTGANQPVSIICRKHPAKIIIKPQASNLLNAPNPQPCEACRQENEAIECAKMTQEFIRMAKLKHGEKTYNYSKTKVGRKGEPIIVICPKEGHGEWQTGPYHATSHKNQSPGGCPKCFEERRGLATKLKAAEKFEYAAKQIHGEKYDYSRVQYIDSKKAVRILCGKDGHGEFLQSPNVHLSGSGCPECGRQKISEEKLIDITDNIFGRLKAVRIQELIYFTASNGKKYPIKKWYCECKCGGSAVVQQGNLVQGLSKSCGCLNSERTAESNMDRELDSLHFEHIARQEAILYFVEVAGYFQKFGYTSKSINERGRQDYTNEFMNEVLTRDVAVPVECVLQEMTRQYWNPLECKKRGYEYWGGWTELRSGLDIEYWKQKAQQLIKECREKGWIEFLDFYFAKE